MFPKINGKLVKISLMSALVLSSLTACKNITGVGSNTNSSIASSYTAIQLNKTDINITDKAQIRVLVNNPWDHQLEYRYTADRGQVVANNGLAATAMYYAPYTGGPDTIRVSVYDRTDGVNLPIISQQVFIQGEAMAYVELPNTANPLTEYDNGLMKVANMVGTSVKKEIGWGRNPVISPDGRYIAYVSYPGDGSSQIIVKDAVGNETNITNHKSFNVDPSWSPIGTDGNQYLVFSSDRVSSNSGALIDGASAGHGERYHLWRVHVNGYDLRQITNTAGNDFQPSWSPDGRQIVFSSDLDNNKSNSFRNIWVLDVATGKQTQYTHETMANRGAYNPQWSPDAKKIVYTRKYQYRQLNKLADFQKVWMIDTNLNSQGFGQIVSKAFDESIVESFPSWSPDGRRITYVRNRGSENSVVSVDFTGITQNQGFFGQPTQESDLTNISEAQWARQRSYGWGYNNPGYNNPWNPSTGAGTFSANTTTNTTNGGSNTPY